MKIKKEEKLRIEKELERKREELRVRFPIGGIIRFYDEGWHHARMIKIDKTAAIVKKLGATNSKRIEFASLDDAMFGTDK